MFRNKLTGEGVSFLTNEFELSRRNDESSHLENEIHAVNMLQFFFKFLWEHRDFFSEFYSMADLKYIVLL